jgi:transcriptional antiterminator NusG
MADHDVVGMLAASQKADDEPTLSGLDFRKGDPVKITDGSFENYEGEVEVVDTKRGLVTVVLTIFGRSTPVEVEYWQVEKL